MAYVRPQAKLFIEFAATPAGAVLPLHACIVGPHYFLRRYAEASEKTQISLGEYAPDVAETVYAWPGRPTGAVVDQDYTRLFCDNALLRYLNVLSSDAEAHPVSGELNRVEFDFNLADYTDPDGTAYPRDARLLRDVRVGDVARVRFGNSVLLSTIRGLGHDTIAGVVGAATVDDDNGDTQLADIVFSGQQGTPDNDVDLIDADGTAYDGRDTGDLVETYTVEVLQGSTDGDATTARLKITSASGRDDVLSVAPLQFGEYTPIGTRGLTALFINGVMDGGGYGYGPTGDDFIIGQKWTITVTQAYTAVTAVSGGTYDGPSDTVYVVRVTEGGASGSAKVSVQTTTGVDSGAPQTVTSGQALTVGRYGVTITLTAGAQGFSYGDRFYVSVSAPKDGAITQIVLANALTTDQQGATDLEVALHMKRNIEISSCDDGDDNWTMSPTQITVNGGIQGYDIEWADGGIPQPMPIRAGTLYVQYRALLQTYASDVDGFSLVGDALEALGPATPDNPLSLGVYKALSNSNGTTVKFMAVPTNDIAGYTKVIDVLSGRDDVFGLVPLTDDAAVLDLFEAHCDDMWSPGKGRYRVLWTGVNVDNPTRVTDDMVTVEDDPNASGTQYTLVQAAAGTFLTSGVRSGDTLRTNYAVDACGLESYEEYVIDAVLDENTLRLVRGPSAAINLESRAEIWRSLDSVGFKDAAIAWAGRFGDNVRTVWPYEIGAAGVMMPGYYAAAGWAGLRSAVAPHQGLTNAELIGFDDVKPALLSESQLDDMAGNGVWITARDPSSGQIYCRHQVTCADYDDIKKREDSVITNIASISYFFLSLIRPFIGRSNITPTTLAQVRTQLEAGISALRSQSFSELLGGQVLDGEVLEVRQHSTLLDHLIIRVSLTVPMVLNNIELTLIV